ncbi:MAG: hypothetical protein ACT4OP_03590 [Actinomycetota bacterium]
MNQQTHLTGNDLQFLAARAGFKDSADLSAELLRRPWALADLLTSPDLIDDLLDPRRGLVTNLSPFLLFAAAIFHEAGELSRSTFISEWVGPRARLPVFGVDAIREFMSEPARCLFLASLLASFAEQGSGPRLDPLALCDLLNRNESANRVPLFRRLGDLALFLAGVLPDHTGAHPLEPHQADRLARSAGLRPGELMSLLHHPSTTGLELMEVLGARWYRLASDPSAPIVGDIATRFNAGRRVLTHLSDRYLFRIQPQWLAMTA